MSSTLHSATSSKRKRRDFWGVVFCVFSSLLQLKRSLKIPIKTSHTERQLVLCSWRWWEYNVFMKLKIRADFWFYKWKGWESRLASMDCRAYPASDRYISVGQKGRKIGRFQHAQNKNYFAFSSQGFIRYYRKEAQWPSPLWALATKTTFKSNLIWLIPATLSLLGAP